MVTRCSTRAISMMAGAILTLTALLAFGATSATAACPNITINNGTGCTVMLYLLCPGATIGPLSIPPGGVLVVPLPAGCMPTVVPIICGNRRPLPVAGGCFTNVSVAPGCCGTVCYTPATCSVTYTPTPGPCPCP